MNKTIKWIKSNPIIIILMLGAFLRLFHLDFQSAWLDEIHTLNESNPEFSFQEVYSTLLIAEPHPPLYFFIMNNVFKIFGYTTLVARLFSAFIGIVGIYTIYLLGKELYSKKVGIYAMILLSVNYFHIYYSQEARMYVLLFFTTTLSFFFLTKLLKNPTIKNTILFSIASTLMIYSHFFALFTLIAQYLILSYYIIFPFKVTKIKFLKYTFVSGIITVLLYIPTYKLILKTTQMKSIWIEMPDLDVYTQFYKDFFGQSELVLFFTILILLLYFIKLFTISETEHYNINPNEHKLTFSFIILFTWIIITLLIPLVRTYTSLPMLINRYFINILPAVLIILAVGLYLIKNKIIKYIFLLIFVGVSLIDIVVVKKYYTSVNKAQFRETTSFIKENNLQNEKIVSSLAWYLPYFFQDKEETKIIDNNLDSFVQEMIKDSTKIENFWYFDGHGRTYTTNQETLDFIEKNFYIENNFDGFQAWTKHFVLLKNKPTTIDISKYGSLQQYNGDGFMYNIERFENNGETVKVSGWAYFDKQESIKTSLSVVLIKNEVANRMNIQKVNRPDVTSYFKNDFNVDSSGFEATYDLTKLEAGNYQIGIYLINETTQKEGLIITDKVITK